MGASGIPDVDAELVNVPQAGIAIADLRISVWKH